MILKEMITKWLVRDYCTPGIKAEVIIDMLISEFVEEIVCAGLQLMEQETEIDKVQLILKEFPIQIDIKDNRNFKADYIVADHKNKIMYLVEFKSADGSCSQKQKTRYDEVEERENNFGEYLKFAQKLVKDYGKEYVQPRSATQMKGSRKYFFTGMMLNDGLNNPKHKVETYKINVQYLSLDNLPSAEDAIVIKEVVSSGEFEKIIKERKKYELWKEVEEILKPLWSEGADGWRKYFK